MKPTEDNKYKNDPEMLKAVQWAEKVGEWAAWTPAYDYAEATGTSEKERFELVLGIETSYRNGKLAISDNVKVSS